MNFTARYRNSQQVLRKTVGVDPRTGGANNVKREPHPMKSQKNKCPLTPVGSSQKCPLEPAKTRSSKRSDHPVVLSRTERRSWITLVVTAFGALLLRYLKTVRERAVKTQSAANKK